MNSFQVFCVMLTVKVRKTLNPSVMSNLNLKKKINTSPMEIGSIKTKEVYVSK